MDPSDLPFISLPLEIRYIIWEYTWPPPMVIKPRFYAPDDGWDSSNETEEEEEESHHHQDVIVLQPVGPLMTFDNYAFGPRVEKYLPPPVALSVCQESRRYTLRHYHQFPHNREEATRIIFSPPNFYFNPKRDVLLFSDIHRDHLPTLRRCYGELLLQFSGILVDYSKWDNEKLRNDILESLRMFGTIDCILISDHDAVRVVDDLWIVIDGDKITARAKGYRSEYEQFLRSLEEQDEAEKQHVACDSADRIWCVDREGNFY